MKKLIPSLFLVAFLSSCSSNGNQHVDWNRTLALLIILAILGLFSALALYSNLLRDTVNDCDEFEAHAQKIKRKRKLKHIKNDNPFSLSRVQLAVWTVIISCSYIYLQLCMGNCNSTDINQTALVLMGIGAGVTAAGTIMDKREIQDGRPRHQNSPSEGFFTDLLSDDQGISIHRFQNVVWTFIAMVIYLHKVYYTTSGCDLPELSQTLLALTGISGATYLVLKAQENNPEVDEDGSMPDTAQTSSPTSITYIPPATQGNYPSGDANISAVGAAAAIPDASASPSPLTPTDQPVVPASSDTNTTLNPDGENPVPAT